MKKFFVSAGIFLATVVVMVSMIFVGIVIEHRETAWDLKKCAEKDSILIQKNVEIQLSDGKIVRANVVSLDGGKQWHIWVYSKDGRAVIVGTAKKINDKDKQGVNV